MKKSIIKQAKNKEEAIRLALNEIGKDRSEVEIEVIEEGSAGFLGLGSKDAVIKVIYDESVEESLFDFEEEIKRDSSKGNDELYNISKRTDYYKNEASANYKSDDQPEIPSQKEDYQYDSDAFEDSIKSIRGEEEDLGEYSRLQKINSYQENSSKEKKENPDLSEVLDHNIDSITKDGYKIERRPEPVFEEEKSIDEFDESNEALVEDSIEESKEETKEESKNESIARVFTAGEAKASIAKEKQQTDIDKYYKAKEFFEDILKEMHFENSSVYGNLEGSTIKLDGKVDENDTGIAIGKGGATLEAIELLIRKSIDSRANNLRVNVDINNYKKRRDEKIRELAADTARKVQRSGKSWNLKYMNSYERRLAHEEIGKFPNVSSHSEGQEPKRYVVVSYVNDDKDQ
ncbi:Jag family protein [Anaerococcus urinomassiliensis]|uniref:Jag family protein n=1 Tax=Anaerococcus urinomassiliensis TaxID=1745712 RepID=UPI0009E38E34|nr:protein jag [Anaerococcus urinomassiliensis]